jgi:hypothetical protein
MPELELGVRPPTALMLLLTSASAAPTLELEGPAAPEGAAAARDGADDVGIPDGGWVAVACCVGAPALDGMLAGWESWESGCAAGDALAAAAGTVVGRTGATPGGVWLFALPRVNTQPSKPPGVTR